MMFALYVLASVSAVLSLQPGQYWCGVDICNGMKYCDARSMRCEWCANNLSDCFTEHHIANCSQFCREQPCQPLGTIVNGKHNGTREVVSFGTTLMSKCNEGYMIIGSNLTKCTEFRQWSHDRPICQAIGCVLPKSIDNGWITVPDCLNKYNPGTVIKYNCYSNYKLLGDANRSCLSKSIWSNEAPVCDPDLNIFDEIVKWKISTGLLAVLLLASLIKQITRAINAYRNRIRKERNIRCKQVNRNDGKDVKDIENPSIDDFIDVDMKLKHVPIQIIINNNSSSSSNNKNDNVNIVSGGTVAIAKPKGSTVVKEIELTKVVQESTMNNRTAKENHELNEGGKPTQESANTATNNAGNKGVPKEVSEDKDKKLVNELRKLENETTEGGAPVVKDQNGIGSLIGIGNRTLDINLSDKY